MAVKFLDNTGLGYFWSKIKAWCNATFAAITHNHASNAVNVMTGYSKPNSSSAIAASDSLNSAIGKLEAKVDAVDNSNVVHKTGNENISGIKSFSVEATNETNGVVIQSSEIIRGTAPSSDKFCSLCFTDSTFDVVEDGNDKDAVISSRLATIDYAARTSGQVDFQFYVMNPANSLNDGVRFRIGYTGNGDSYFIGPQTRSNPALGEIITYSWLPNDARILHTTGDESLSGIKTYNDAPIIWYDGNYSILKHVCNFTKGSSSTATEKIASWAVFENNNNSYIYKNRLGAVDVHVYTNGLMKTQLLTYKNTADSTTATAVEVGYDENDIPFAVAPQISTTRTNSYDIVTRSWLTNVKTFKSPLTVTYDGSYSNINHILNVTKGTNPSDTTKMSGIVAYDKSGLNVADRIAMVTNSVDTNGTTYSSLIAYKYVSSSSDNASFQCICGKDGTVYQRSNTIRPHTTNAYSLGTGSYKYTAVYATNGSIQTSDERLKHNIEVIPDNILDVWENIEWKQFYMIDSVQAKGLDKARIHTGAIAQQIQKIFNDSNLDAAKYGFFCYDEWEQTQEIRTENGEILTPYQPAGNSYALRYEEVLCIEAAYQRRKNKILENRISELEKQVSDMLQTLQSLKGAS